MLEVVLASGTCGLLLGRYFRVYTMFPTMPVLVAAACLAGRGNGALMGALAYGFSLLMLQGCFLVAAMFPPGAAGKDLAPSTHNRRAG